MTDSKSVSFSRLKVFALLGVLLVAAAGAYVWMQSNGKAQLPQKHQVPALSEQPIDTIVAEQSVMLHHWTGEQQVEVYFVPTEVLPIVDVRIDFDAGSARDGQTPGVAQMTALMLSEGTTRMSTDEFNEAMEGYGVQYAVQVDKDRLGITLRAMANKDLDAVIHLLQEMMSSPRFAPEDLQRVKQQWMVKLQQDLQQPGVLAARKFYHTLYGQHPYAMPTAGTMESIEAMTEVEIKAFHQKHLTARNMVITVVGGIHRDKARQIGNQLIKALPKGEPLPSIPEVQKLALDKEQRVDFNTKQAHVIFGQLGRDAADEMRYPLIVGNHILGGTDMVARLFQEVREKRGLAYSVYSYFQPLRQKGPFALSLQTQIQHTGEAVSVMRDTLQKFVEQGPTEEELIAAKKYLVGSFPLQLSSNQQILDTVSHMAFYHLPYDFLDEYTAKIEQVKIEDIKKTFQERIHPNEMTLVIVGGKKA